VGRARFEAPVGVACHAAGGARDERSTVHPRLTRMATTQAKASICLLETARCRQLEPEQRMAQSALGIPTGRLRAVPLKSWARSVG
jgi:hypothetical protein